MPKGDDPSKRVIEALGELAELGAVDLGAQATGTSLPRAYGRDEEIDPICQSLLQNRSVLLLGPSGVGKTAIIREIAIRIARRQAPPELLKKRIVAMSTTTIERGAMNPGMWSERLGDVVDALRQGQDIYLYITNIWDLRDAGRYAGETQSFATHLRPLLEQKAITLIGESTQENFERQGATGAEVFPLAADPALVACFTVVRVAEPDEQRSKAILSSVAIELESATGVQIGADATERSVELARRFFPYQAMPGKAVHLLRDVVQGLTAPAVGAAPGSPSPASGPSTPTVVTPDMLVDGVVHLTGLPIHMVSDRVPLLQSDILSYFGERVIGQPTAVDAVVDLVTLMKSELNDPGRPLGVLLFIGPTGCGKTLLAKTLAEYMFGSERRLIRFDMSEFKYDDSAPHLSQMLVERVRRGGFSVVLLDEIEKANPQCFDLFLQAFDDARIADASGRTADLHNTIFVMTSNLRVEQSRVRRIGFGAPDSGQSDEVAASEPWMRAVREFFRPEFVNRLDQIVVFRTLDRANMRQIARKELSKALELGGVARRSILLDFRDEVVDVILSRGFSESFGARPLKRAIRDLVLLPLARRIAAHPDEGEQLLELHARDRQIEIVPIPLGPAGPRNGEHAAIAEGEPKAVSDEEAAPAEREAPTRLMRLEEIEAAIVGLRDRLAAHRASGHYGALEDWSRSLLELSAAPDFWADQSSARAVYRAIYAAERVTDQIAALLERAEAMAEIPGFIKRHRDAAGIPGLQSKLHDLASEVELAELEFLSLDPEAGAAIGAFVCVAPAGAPNEPPCDEWADTLLAMYAAWATDRGYESEAVHAPGAHQRVLLIRGPGIGRMLLGECGIHRRLLPPDQSKNAKHSRPKAQLARVQVLPIPTGSGEWGGTLNWDDVTVVQVPGGAGGEARKRARARHGLIDQAVEVIAEDAMECARLLVAAMVVAAVSPAGENVDKLARVYGSLPSPYVRDPGPGSAIVDWRMCWRVT